MTDELNTTAPRAAPAPGGLLERLLDEVEADPTASPSAPASADASPPSPVGSSLPEMLLRNTSLLSALPSLMENLASLPEGLGGGTENPSRTTRPPATDRHTALLCALKPYLSPRRRDTAETVIRLCRIWDALEKSGISLTGLLSARGSDPMATEGRDDGVQ